MKTISPKPVNPVKAAAAKYLKVVLWSDEDQCYVGRCPGLFFGGCHGQNETKVYADLCKLVEEHLAELLANRETMPPATTARSYSGKFLVRVTPELHQAAALKAEARGESLNKLVADAIAVA